MLKTLTLAAAMVALGGAPAFAHADPGAHGSLFAGVFHPLFGADHILAMVAVGLWAALLGGRALWLVPAAFVATMAAGFASALLGAPLPFVEPVILASVVVIGLVAAMALSVPTGFAMALAGFFAFFHGHAHGGELGEAGALSFALGFVVSTALLHIAGSGMGLGLRRLFGGSAGQLVTRFAGGATALAGIWLAIAG